MGGSAPTPPPWREQQAGAKDAAQTQLGNNRINTSNPYASQTFGDGTTSTQLSGGLGAAANGLMGQAGALGQPMDWSQFSQPGNGSDANNQAFNASYGQATSRLDPTWDRAQEAQRTQLLNQGLDPSSEAHINATDDFSRSRNDAYGQAMGGSLNAGMGAQDSAARNNMLSYQQSVADAIRQRQMPLEEMGKLSGLTSQPGYNQDSTAMQAYLASMGISKADYETAMGNKQASEDSARDVALAGGGAAIGIAGATAPYWTKLFGG